MSIESVETSGEAGQPCYSQADVDRHMVEAKDHLGKFLLLSIAAGPSATHFVSQPAAAIELGSSCHHLIDACKHYNEAKRIDNIIHDRTPIIKYDGPIIK